MLRSRTWCRSRTTLLHLDYVARGCGAKQGTCNAKRTPCFHGVQATWKAPFCLQGACLSVDVRPKLARLTGLLAQLLRLSYEKTPGSNSYSYSRSLKQLGEVRSGKPQSYLDEPHNSPRRATNAHATSFTCADYGN